MVTMMMRSLSSAASRRWLLFLSRASLSSSSSFSSPPCSNSILRRPSPAPFAFANRVPDCWPQFALGFRRSFSSDISQLPVIADPDVEAAFKDLIASSWDEIPEAIVYDVKKALSKATEDKTAQEALVNVFRAAEASVEFGAVLVSLRMALDDINGLAGENVGPLPDDLVHALAAAYKCYMAYLDAFSPDETYLRKKVEIELGTKMVHLKRRCSGLGSQWGKVSVLGTSGLSGSYVEHRAP